MPDKQNESKFMAMLERRGLVQKVDTVDGSLDENPAEGNTNGPNREGAGEHVRDSADLQALIEPSGDEAVKVKPAAHQPVPGMISQILSAERPQKSENEQPGPAPRAVSEKPKPSAWADTGYSRASEIPKPTPFFSGLDFDEDIPAVGQPMSAPSSPVEMRAPLPHDAEGTLFDADAKYMPTAPIAFERLSGPPPVANKNAPEPPPPTASTVGQPVNISAQPVNVGAQFATEKPPIVFESPQPAYNRTPEPPPSAYEKPPARPAVEDYTARYLEIDQLYDALSMKAKRTDTIYLIEEYLKTLPESLPDESRREIVSKIVAASGFDFDVLMGDGILRTKMLKEYAERFAKHTDDYISARNAEVDELEQQIMRLRRLIENRRDLHKKQLFAIESEAQRLKDILTFISG